MYHLFKRTLALAQKGKGHVYPNPEVGCVVVKNGDIIGEGFHKYFGGPHAEKEAVFDAESKGQNVENSEVYVSLEPCVHQKKKTPPCAQFLVQKKVKSVYILFQDKNPKVDGRGAKYLEENGIPVYWAPQKIQDQFYGFYDPFFHSLISTLPYRTLKLALTHNKSIGNSRKRIMISGKECKHFTAFQRDIHASVLTTPRTIFSDNPVLKGNISEPFRIALGKTPLHHTEQTLSFCRDTHYTQIFSRLSDSADLPELTSFLKENNLPSVWIEAGKHLSEFLLKTQGVDRVILYRSPQEYSDTHALFIDLQNLHNHYTQAHNFYLGKDQVEIWDKKR